jgi:hypothetical protein
MKMKKTVNILIEEEVIRQAKHLAVKEGKPFSTVIQDALISYLSGKMPDPRKREGAYQLFCEQPMRITKKQFKEIMEVDSNE